MIQGYDDWLIAQAYCAGKIPATPRRQVVFGLQNESYDSIFDVVREWSDDPLAEEV